MVRPTQPKGIKPKTEAKGPAPEAKEASTGFGEIKLLIVNTVITLLICLLFIISNYFIVQSSLSTAVKSISGSASASGDEQSQNKEDAQVERGLILDLGEFVLNLSDPKTRRYVKINVALELTRIATDPKLEKAGEKKEGGSDSMAGVEQEMSQFKPAIRDAVINIISSKTAEELSSVAGKDMAKEQIKEQVNAIFGGEREVIRVSFGNFIIQ